VTVLAALAEDVGRGDVTTNAVIGVKQRASAQLVARERCVIAGVAAAFEAFRALDPAVKVLESVRDGDALSPGQVALRVEGLARALLSAERVALNFVQRLSGVATATRRFVEAAGPRVKVLHTRKTTPGLRELERRAVEAGGGGLHRAGLDDEILLKENHFSLSRASYSDTIRAARAATPKGVVLGAEATNREEACAAVEAGVDYVLLDNFTPEQLAVEVAYLRDVMQRTGARVLLEASGGIDVENIARFAASGVDRVSCGALTHSARSIDFSLDVTALDAATVDATSHVSPHVTTHGKGDRP
jgi:nicotinate-nucleotide pyrophosphorylase (carboxylating)